MKPKATKSAFDSIRITLGIVAICVLGGFHILSSFFVGPKLIGDRAQAIFSVIRSHEGNIVLNKTRSVRDELLANGGIKEDQQFSHYFSNERETVRQFLSQCTFVSSNICLGDAASVFLATNSSRAPKDDFKFAVVLKNDLTRTPALLTFWEGILALLLGAAFWFIHRKIQQKEKYLLGRLSVAGRAFERARVLFGGQKSGSDEFDTIGKSAEDLVVLLEEYKEKFERKTRLEQLGLTVGEVSHDLKAPLNEAENFLKSLPLLLDSISKEELSEAVRSLVKRIQGGKEALDRALKTTKRMTIAREELPLGSVLTGVAARALKNPKLQALIVQLAVPKDYTTLGDRLKLETALLNLLDNTADEKRNARVALTLTQGEPGHAKIIYEDDGNGIPEEFLEKVFEPLVTFKASGTGFGLSSTKAIFAEHGGRIRALPKLGGAKFEIELPAMGGGHA